MKIKFGSIEISNENPKVFVIAEIGNNHNGSYQRALEMIDKAIEAGADCVKFQMRKLDEVYRKKLYLSREMICRLSIRSISSKNLN